MNKTNPVVLVVDDTPENLNLLTGYLGDRYRVKVATDGERALKVATTGEPPDIILLDIMMPGMDGFEVCRRLKEHKHLNDVPILFILVLADVDNKIVAFTSGRVDHLTKPFQPGELEAHVSTHLALRNMQKQVEEQNNRLDDVVGQKGLKLA